MALDRPGCPGMLLLVVFALILPGAIRSTELAAKEELARLASGNTAAADADSSPCRDLETSDCLNLDFARRMMADPASRTIQRRFSTLVHQLSRDPPSALAELRRAAGSYVVLFAPGWMYRSQPRSGASFEVQRRLLAALGLETRLIETAESASVEDNAAVIAQALRRPVAPGQHRVLVSTSKAGPEVALALGKLLDEGETESIAAWINVGGALRGSPAADVVLASWVRPLIRLHFALSGLDWSGLLSLATGPRRRNFEELCFPPRLQIVNYVAVPLVSDLSGFSDFLRPAMRPTYANDGLTLLDDAVVPGSVTVIQPGADHYFKLPDIDRRALALLGAAIELVDQSSRTDARLAHTCNERPESRTVQQRVR